MGRHMVSLLFLLVALNLEVTLGQLHQPFVPISDPLSEERYLIGSDGHQ